MHGTVFTLVANTARGITSRQIQRGVFCFIVLLVALLHLPRLLAPAHARVERNVTPLEPGKAIERELAGGQNHSYQITLAAGQYLSVIVEQRGIDVVVALSGPDGKQLAEFDGEPREQGRETISQVAEAPGGFRLSVQARQKGAPAGRYEIRMAELRAAAMKDRDLQEARKLHAEADRLWRAGKFDEAMPLANRSLEIREREIGPEHPDLAQTLNRLATIHASKGDRAKAEPLYQRALAMQEKTLGMEHPAVAASLNNLASLYQDKGDYAKAEPLLRRSLAMREKTLGAEHLNTAVSLHNLANLYYVKGDYAGAEPLYQRAIAIREKTLGADHPLVASSLNGLAVLYNDKGQFKKAEPLYQRMLVIQEKTLGPEHHFVAGTIHNLALLCQNEGDYARAEPLYQRALAIREKALGTEHPTTADSFSDLALLYYDKGDYAKAESFHQRALAIREKSLGMEHPKVAASVGSLAIIYQTRGDYAKAESLHLRALAIREKALGAEHPDTAESLGNLAALHYEKGDYAKAEPLSLRALAIREKALGAEHPVTATSLNNLALLLHYGGKEYAKAESLYQRALAIREKTLGAGHPDVARSLGNLAIFSAAKGELKQAIEFQSRAAAVSERNISLNLATGSDRQKLAYLDALADEWNRTISLHVRFAPNDPAARGLAATILLQRKGRALDATTDSFATLRRRLVPQEQVLLEQLQDANSQLARLVFGGPQKTTPAEHRNRIKNLEEQIETLQSGISGRSDLFRAQSQPVTIETVRSAIPANAVLIEFALYHPFNAGHTKREEAFGDARYVAYLLRPEGEIQWVELGEARAIDAAVGSWRQALRDRARRDVDRLARDVDRRVMQPLRPLLPRRGRIFLSPDGALNLIPFAALVDERRHYLVTRYSFNYLTGGRDLLRLQVARESKSAALVLADPAFGAAAEAVMSEERIRPAQQTAADADSLFDFTRLNLRPLPGTAVEAQAIKRVLPQAMLLTGDRATETALKQASAPEILHVATHGFFLQDRQAASDGTRGFGLAVGEITKPLSGALTANPLLRSGLVLAGVAVRQSGADQEDDGVLTALEASGLDLWGTKLVVLSACDTGVGEVKNGDGVYGLRRALVLAGSESQLMSLWPVSDKGTRDLMIAYYRELQRGEGRGEALRQVQLRMLQRKDRRHPYYWASFIQSGEWKSLDGKEPNSRRQ